MEKVYAYTVTDEAIFENIFKDEKILMNHVVVLPGNIFPKHPTDAVVYALVVRGELSVTIEDQETSVYKAGHLVNIPKGANTELGNRGGEPLELFVTKIDFN